MVNPSVGPPQTRVELADVIRQFAPQYIAQYGDRMMPSQKKALADIAACCTRELGGRLYHCDDCHETFWRYHCCRNRACPKCHASQTQDWLSERQAELLPCDYFHAVVTVPKELRTACRRNQKLFYGLLMRVSAAAVQELCAEKRLLGALPGILAVLHTWNGRLAYHPHVHLLITGFCFFRVANRHTLGAIFGRDPLSPEFRDAHRRMAVEAVLGYLHAGTGGAHPPGIAASPI